MQIGEGQPLDERARLLEILVALAREADHDVGPDGGLWHGFVDALDAVLVVPGAVAAMHQAQDAVAAALQGDMGMTRDARRGRHEVRSTRRSSPWPPLS